MRALIVLSLCSPLAFAETVFKSTSEPVGLIELYTSEGCSSCPPADRWLSTLVEDPRLWKTFFPLSFHVDYWDYLGWHDRFAHAKWSNRQRQHRRQGHTRGIYTPALIISGLEWHGWRRAYPLPRFLPQGELVLNVTESTGQFKAQYEKKMAAAVEFHIALIGVGLINDIHSGENRGRRLQHDFVVLDMESYSELPEGWSGMIPRSDHMGSAQRLAVVAWVTHQGQLKPLQVVGGWLGEGQP